MKNVLSCRQESLHKSVEQPKCKTFATLDSLSAAHRAKHLFGGLRLGKRTRCTQQQHRATKPQFQTSITEFQIGGRRIFAAATASLGFRQFEQPRRNSKDSRHSKPEGTHRSKSPKKNQRNFKLFLWNYQALTPIECAKVAHLIEMCCSNMCKQKKLVVICMRFKTMICHLSGDSIENLRASASASLLRFPTQQSRNVVDFLRIKFVASLLCLFVSPCAITHGYMQNLTQRSWGDKF